MSSNVHRSTHADRDQEWDIAHECNASRSALAPEDLEMSTKFISDQRRQGGGTSGAVEIPAVEPEQLNDRQRQAFEVVRYYVQNQVENTSHLHMMVLRTAGTGKSRLVYAVPRFLRRRVRRAVPTGMAAFLVGSNTLHTRGLLQLPLKREKPF